MHRLMSTVYKYNGGEFKVSKESGKLNGQKFNTLIYQTMPNGLGGTLTLKYVCLIDLLCINAESAKAT